MILGRVYPSFVAARYLRRMWTAYVAILAVTIAVMVLVVVISVMDGFQNQIRANIRGTLSDLSVRNVTNEFGIEDDVRTLDLSEVKALSPRQTGPVLIDRGGNRNYALEFAIVVGIDGPKEADTTGLRDYLIDYLPDIEAAPPERVSEELRAAVTRVSDFKHNRSNQLFPTHGPGGEIRYPGIIIGKQLARTLLLWPGDTISLATVPQGQLQQTEDRRARFRPKLIKFTIIGLYETNEYEFAGKHIFMDLRDSQDYFEIFAPSEILVKLHDHEQARDVKEVMRRQLDPGYYVATWEDRRRNLLDAIDVERSLMIILLFFVFVVASFLIFAVLTMMVREKTKDIGILRSMGATRGGVLATFLWCGLFIGLVGSVAGVGLGVFIAENLNNFNDFCGEYLDWKIFPDEVYGFEEIPIYIDPAWLAIVGGMGFGCSLLAAIVPAMLAAFKTPVEAIRYE